MRCKKCLGEGYKCEMKISVCRCGEHVLRAFRNLAGGFSRRCPQDDIEFRRNDCEKPFIGSEPCEQIFCRISAFCKVRGEGAVTVQGQMLLCRPKRHGGRAGPRAFETDFSKMKFR